MKKHLSLLLLLGALFSCSNDDDKQSQIIEMRVNHFQKTAMAEGPMLTLLVQEGDQIGTDRWNSFYADIEGFTYEAGTVYDLSVKAETIDNPPADGSSIRYTLLSINSTQEVDFETTFEIDLKTNGTNYVTTDAGLQLLNQIDIDCNALCDELETALQNQGFVVGTFTRVSSNEIRLIGLE